MSARDPLNAQQTCNAPGCPNLRTLAYFHPYLCDEHERMWRTEGWRLGATNSANAAAKAKADTKAQAKVAAKAKAGGAS